MIIFQQDQNYIKEHANYKTGVWYESQFNFYIKHDTMLLNVVSTLDPYNTSETRSNQKSFGLNYQKTGKELMSQDEITVMDGGKCIYQLRGVRPFLSDKFDITKHKNYKLLEDYDKKNLFDIESYMKRKGKAKLNKDTLIIRI